MARLIMTKGLPGSSKSTWARELCDKEPGRWKLVDKDSLRKLLDNGRWSKHNEQFVLRIRDHIVREALGDGQNVIVHDTNFEPIHEQRLRELAKGHQFEVKFFDVDVEECIKRDLKRLDSVGERVIRDMHRKYLQVKPKPAKKIEGVPSAIICDIDGTLALFEGKRSPFDASRCDEIDELNEPVATALRSYWYGSSIEFPRKVILMSGRMEKDRAPTERWLRNNFIHFDALYMRATDDQRKDSIVKHELYEQHVKDRYNIDGIYDDRRSVVELWRSLGLTCFQVAPGDF